MPRKFKGGQWKTYCKTLFPPGFHWLTICLPNWQMK